MDYEQKLTSLIGLMFRAKKIVYGVKLVEGIKSKKVRYVIAGLDMGSTQIEMLRKKNLLLRSAVTWTANKWAIVPSFGKNKH